MKNVTEQEGWPKRFFYLNQNHFLNKNHDFFIYLFSILIDLFDFFKIKPNTNYVFLDQKAAIYCVKELKLLTMYNHI